MNELSLLLFSNFDFHFWFVLECSFLFPFLYTITSVNIHINYYNSCFIVLFIGFFHFAIVIVATLFVCTCFYSALLICEGRAAGRSPCHG